MLAVSSIKTSTVKKINNSREESYRPQKSLSVYHVWSLDPTLDTPEKLAKTHVNEDGTFLNFTRGGKEPREREGGGYLRWGGLNKHKGRGPQGGRLFIVEAQISKNKKKNSHGVWKTAGGNEVTLGLT